MAAEVLMQDDIHRSMATSEDDADFEEDDDLGTHLNGEHADALAANNQLHNGLTEQSEEEDELELDDESEEEEEPILSDEDAEGEEDDDVAVQDEEEEDEDAEGVGAVKIQPGLLEDEEEAVSHTDEDDDFAASLDDEEEDKESSEAGMGWDPAAADEDEDPANPNRCIFCHQDEENDPSEDFEMYLTCDVCADNAHRQCARDNNALQPGDEAEIWRCPNCVANKLEPGGAAGGEDPASEDIHDSASRRTSSNRKNPTDDLLPSQRGNIKPDSHSIFDSLIDPEDPCNGTRYLRKRKTSSADAELGQASKARKRNRDKDLSSSTRSSDAHSSQIKDEVELDAPESTSEPTTNGNRKTEEPFSPRTSRSLRPKQPQAHARIDEKSATSIKIVIRIDPIELRHLQSMPPKPKKKKSSRVVARASGAPSTHLHGSFSQPFYSLHDKELDDLKSKPYGGILTEAEADTTISLPKPEHRRQFDEARQRAEHEWKANAIAAAEAAALAGAKRARKVSGPASQIENIEFGTKQIDIWYAAPYPEEYSRNKTLFICEFCLKYMESPTVAWRHKTKCPWKHPPGDEIYREGRISMFEVDGRKNPLYCQNLCLLAKLFLGSKTLYYDVEPFLFYVMTEYDEKGYHFVGYFSKEKRASSLNNVSCILVLPIHQRKGYGHLLIDFSYLLTRVEKKTGSPEKPLSDMGLVSYRNYWRLIMSYYLRRFQSGACIPSIKTMSDDTGMTPDDVVSTLEALEALIRDPVTGVYGIQLKSVTYEDIIRRHEAKNYAKLNPKSLTWTAFVMGRGNASHFELAPLNTVAPREDGEDEGMVNLSTSNKRDFATFNSMNGATEVMTEALSKLNTNTGELVKIGGSVKSESTPKLDDASLKEVYFVPAASIPPTRFEVFPPVPGSKKSVARASVSRQRSSLSISSPLTNKSSTGSASRRAANGRTSTRRESTGRGPGRYPKGTKKSDFGNADSGPGLPPKLEKKRSRLGQEVLIRDEEDEDAIEDGDAEDEDAILYETPAPRKRSSRDTRGSVRGLGKPMLGGKPSGKPAGKPGGKGKGGKSLLVDDDGDAEMDDAPLVEGDVDAEGEDE